MNAGLLILLGGVLLGVGIYSFMNRDGAWESQVSANEMRGLVSERTGTWEINQSIRGGMAILAGAVLLVAGLVGLAAPQHPAGSYGCMVGSVTNSTITPTILTLRSDGKGTYGTQPLTWSYDGKTVTFQGDNELVSGNFPLKDDPKTLVVTDRSGTNQTCWLRS